MSRFFTCVFLALCVSALAVPPAPVKSGAYVIEQKALTVLARSQEKMFRLKTYQAECEATLMFPPQDGKPARRRREVSILQAVKPNRMRFELRHWKQDAAGKWTRNTKRGDIIFVCDGKAQWKQFGSYYRKSSDAKPNQLHTISEPWDGFYSRNGSPFALLVLEVGRRGHLTELRHTGREVVNGVQCDKVFAHVKTGFQGDPQEWRQTYFVGHDGLVRRLTEKIEFGDQTGYTRDCVMRNIKINQPIKRTTFAYAPPPGVRLETERKEPPRLANGTSAPDFAAIDKDGRSVKLSDFRGKVVVLDFWASWCAPCLASIPHNQKVMKTLQAEGLPAVLLAVDNGEERDAFLSWANNNSGELPALTFAHVPPKDDISGRLYHVSGIPTQYVIDKSGIIRASSVGYGGPSDMLEKSIRAALNQP